MKLVSRLLLILFVAFLSTPTVVTLIKKQTDISVFYNFAEEEIHKNYKEIKADFKDEHSFVFLEESAPKNIKIIFENLSRHDNVTSKIFSPPPNLI